MTDAKFAPEKGGSVALRLLVTESELEGSFVAVCLEHYIVGQGGTPNEAFLNFQSVLASELAYGIQHYGTDHILDDIPPAPREYVDRFNQGGPATRRDIDPIEITIGDEWKTISPLQKVEIQGNLAEAA